MYGSKSKIPVLRECQEKRPPLASAITLNKTPFCLCERGAGRRSQFDRPKFSYPGLQANSLRETGSSWQFTLAVVSLTTRFNSSIEDHDTMRHEKKKREHRIGQCGRVLNGAWRRPLVLVALLGVFTSVAFGQLSTADILGTVTDATGAVVPNATVVLKDLATNGERTTKTNDSGDYNFTLLPVGHYSIEVKAPGFQEAVTKDLPVEAGDRARNDVHMTIGQQSSVVEVTAATPLLQADSATVSSTVTAKAVQDLPLNGRNFVQLVALIPGANEGPGSGLSSGNRPDDRRSNAAGLSVNGQDESLNNWVVDGIDDNERVIGTIGVKPNVEGIQEITVETNSYAPEAGRTAGGVINILTRSGTDQFHGSVYEYFRNNIFDGRNYFQTAAQGPKPELRQNQYGGSIGGPILKIEPSSSSTTKDFARFEASRILVQYRPFRNTTTFTA